MPWSFLEASLPCIAPSNDALSNKTVWKWGDPRFDASFTRRKSTTAAGPVNAVLSNEIVWKWEKPRVDTSSNRRKSANAAGRKFGEPLIDISNSPIELFLSTSGVETDKPDASPMEASDKNVLNDSHSNC